MTKPPYAKNLVRLRAAADISQQEVATATGLSRAAISSYELGNRQPKIEAIAALAKFYGVAPIEIDPTGHDRHDRLAHWLRTAADKQTLKAIHALAIDAGFKG